MSPGFTNEMAKPNKTNLSYHVNSVSKNPCMEAAKAYIPIEADIKIQPASMKFVSIRSICGAVINM